MEFMDAGALTEVVLCTVLSEPQMATVCREVCDGISYLHQHEVVHRDIKSDNILLNMKGTVKITGDLIIFLVHFERGGGNTFKL